MGNLDMKEDQLVREQLVHLMQGGNAFFPMTKVLESTPFQATGKEDKNLPHTIWELTEHLRICLHDLVEYSKDSHFQSPPWPEGYWPKKKAPHSKEAWQKSVNHIKDLLNEMIQMVSNPENNLYAPFEANPNHHLLRQATIVAEHNAYHTGQIVMVRKVLGAW